MTKSVLFISFISIIFFSCANKISRQAIANAGNPVFPGWYADPEGAVFDGKYWIYPTYSAPFD